MGRARRDMLTGRTTRLCFAVLASFGASPAVALENASPARHVETWRIERTTTPQRGRLLVKVGGLQPRVGRLLVALYDAKTPFLSFEHQLDRQRVAVKERVTEAMFEDVPYGNYAIAVVYDKNNNNRLDMRLGVMPTEPLGFSGGARVGAFGPPRYRAAAFDFAAPQMTVTIDVE